MRSYSRRQFVYLIKERPMAFELNFNPRAEPLQKHNVGNKCGSFAQQVA